MVIRPDWVRITDDRDGNLIYHYADGTQTRLLKSEIRRMMLEPPPSPPQTRLSLETLANASLRAAVAEGYTREAFADAVDDCVHIHTWEGEGGATV